MGFWSGLGKVLSIAGPIAAIPFTGGASGSLLGALGAGKAAAGIGAATGMLGSVLGKAGDAGRVASGAAEGMQSQRNQQEQNALMRDRLALDRSQLGVVAPDARARQAARGDLQANVQDVNIDFKPRTGALPQFNVSGGVRPSAMGPNARQAGSELSRQALLALMTKSDVPELSQPSKSSVGEKVLGGAGLSLNLLGAASPLLELLKKRGAATPPYVPPQQSGWLSPQVKAPTFGAGG